MTEQQFEDACNVLYSGNHAANRDELLAAFKELYESVKWQPIETAPEDGSPIFYYIHSIDTGGLAEYYDGLFCIYVNFQEYDTHVPLDPQPTHWMPIPKAPK